MLRGYSWLCTQELLLEVLRGPYGMLGIEPGSAACKANALPAVPSLQPQIILFIYLILLFGSCLAMHRGYSWLCTQELPLVVLPGLPSSHMCGD